MMAQERSSEVPADATPSPATRGFISLAPFCARHEMARAYLEKPWSRGEFTYATNGHVAVRVARRADVPECPEAPDCGKVLIPDAAPVYDGPIALPAPETTECRSCDGRKYEHECPDCSCECEDCDGAGVETSDGEKSVGIFGQPYALHYIRLLTTLPGLVLCTPKKPDDFSRLPFRFDGGIGCLCGLRSNARDHIEVISKATGV